MMKTAKVFKELLVWTVIVSVSGLVHTPRAQAWGSYGHQQVNVAAVELLNEKNSDNPMVQCLKKNSLLIQRLAITPDYDWKKLGNEIDANYNTVPLSAKQNPDGTRNSSFKSTDPRRATDVFEHPLHYFEADAFFADSSRIPVGDVNVSGDYTAALQSNYIKLRGSKDRMEAIKKIDPAKGAAKADIDAVRAHGTAPWRIKQLFDLGVENLKAYIKGHDEKKLQLALIYLGAMGHYVGDMSQPFHTSLNFDGEYDPENRNPVLSSGIHAAFESVMFQQIVDDPDKTTFRYASFDKTDADVLKSANDGLKGASLASVNEEKIIAEVLSLVSSAPQYVEPLLGTLWKEAQNHPVRGKGAKAEGADSAPDSDAGAQTPTNGKTPKKPTAIKGGHRLPSSEREPATAFFNKTVLKVAEQRIGESATLLARLWLSAFIQAGSLKDLNCGTFDFDRRMVVENYPQPLYLPAGHQKAPAGHPATHTDSTAHPGEDQSHAEFKASPPSVVVNLAPKQAAAKPPAPAAKKPLKPSADAVRAFSADTI